MCVCVYALCVCVFVCASTFPTDVINDGVFMYMYNLYIIEGGALKSPNSGARFCQQA